MSFGGLFNWWLFHSGKTHPYWSKGGNGQWKDRIKKTKSKLSHGSCAGQAVCR